MAGTVRSENISKIIRKDGSYSDSHRRVIMRTFEGIFSNCFKNNKVYELLTDTKSSGKNIPSNLKPYFVTPTFFYKVNLYPVNVNFVNNEWCDYIATTLNSADSFTGTLYKFLDIVNLFNKNYLNEKAEFNFFITNDNIDRGISVKYPPFDNIELNFATVAKTIRTFFTLNSMVYVALPGNISRKANEIIFIDKEITISQEGEVSQSAYPEVFNSNYFFVTRVVHDFKGQNYDNELFVTSFSKPKK